MGLHRITGRSGSGINLSGFVTLDFIPFNIKTVYDDTVQYYDTKITHRHIRTDHPCGYNKASRL